MAEENGLIGVVDQLNKLNHAVFGDDGKLELLKDRVVIVENKTEWNAKEIKEVKADIKQILENTQWVKRAILTAIIGTLTSGIIGGSIAVIWSVAGK